MLEFVTISRAWKRGVIQWPIQVHIRQLDEPRQAFRRPGLPRPVTVCAILCILKATPIDRIVPLYYRYNWGGKKLS